MWVWDDDFMRFLHMSRRKKDIFCESVCGDAGGTIASLCKAYDAGGCLAYFFYFAAHFIAAVSFSVPLFSHIDQASCVCDIIGYIENAALMQALSVPHGDKLIVCAAAYDRSEEHTSELQSQSNIVC